MRLRIRRNVDFPQPDGPMSAVTRPAGIVSETRSRTWWLPNHAEIDCARSSARPDGSNDGAIVGTRSRVSSAVPPPELPGPP
jgi:hypothetical protein